METLTTRYNNVPTKKTFTTAGGLQPYYEERLNREAETVGFAKAVANWKQLRLF